MMGKVEQIEIAIKALSAGELEQLRAWFTEFDAANWDRQAEVRELADKNYELLKSDPQHPSLQFKVIGRFRSVRVGLRYRALGIEMPDGANWFWIGTHAEYDRLVG
jgi:mRNA-degrading endonuclease HigB of HigAB toxin-antitoxin module